MQVVDIATPSVCKKPTMINAWSCVICAVGTPITCLRQIIKRTRILTANKLMKSKLKTSVLNLGLLAAVSATAMVGNTAWAADPLAGRGKAETCLGCHGIPAYVNVYPTYHVPKIGGQHEQYLIAALTAYRNKTRSHGTMQANAAGLSDADIADIAAYFASLK